MVDLAVGTGAIASAGNLTGAEAWALLQSGVAKEVSADRFPFYNGTDYLLSQSSPSIRWNSGGPAIKSTSANRLGVYNDGTTNERISIQSTGRISMAGLRAIGIADIQGSGNVRVMAGAAGGYALSTYDTQDYTAVQFVRDVAGTPTQNGLISVGLSSTAYTTTSDYRQKENITPLTDALQRLRKIPVHRFNFKVSPDRRVDGFLAHELAEIVPEAVIGERDAEEEIGTALVYARDDQGRFILGEAIEINGIPEHEVPDGASWTRTGTRLVLQSVDQSKIVPLLVAAVQELTTKVEALEAQLAQ